MPKLLLPLLALLAIGCSAAGGVYLATRGETVEEVPRPAADLQTTSAATPTPAAEQPPAKGQLWRWVNVTVAVPQGSDVYVVQTSYPPEVNPPDGGPVLTLARDTNPSDEFSSSLLIDAEDGTILRDNVLKEDRAAIDEVLGTLMVAPLDRATAAWPYKDEAPPDLPRERVGNISYIRPAPESGILVYGTLNDPGGTCGVSVTNGRSGVGVYVDEATRTLVTHTERLLPEDKPVFERYLATVKLSTSEAAC